MIQIIHYRKKCIGCNACVEMLPSRWVISRKDGRSVLIGSEEKKGFYILHVPDSEREVHVKVSKACPTSIIRIKHI